MFGEPCLQPWQGQVVEPRPVDPGELPDERHEGGIRQARLRAAEMTGKADPRFQILQEREAEVAMPGSVRAVPIGIFVPVQVLLEHTVVGRDQCRVVASEPVLRVPDPQRLTHDRKAFLDHCPFRRYEHRHRALWRHDEKLWRLGRKPDLPKFITHAADCQRQSRPHRKGATTKAVEDVVGHGADMGESRMVRAG